MLTGIGVVNQSGGGHGSRTTLRRLLGPDACLAASRRGGQPPRVLPTKGAYPLRDPQSRVQCLLCVKSLVEGTGVEPRFVACSALMPASQPPAEGASPLASSPRRGPTPFETPSRGFKVFFLSKVWWRARESNPRPQRCERCALPTELAPHNYSCVFDEPKR